MAWWCLNAYKRGRIIIFAPRTNQKRDLGLGSSYLVGWSKGTFNTLWSEIEDERIPILPAIIIRAWARNLYRWFIYTRRMNLHCAQGLRTGTPILVHTKNNLYSSSPASINVRTASMVCRMTGLVLFFLVAELTAKLRQSYGFMSMEKENLQWKSRG